LPEKPEKLSEEVKNSMRIFIMRKRNLKKSRARKNCP
jgi:hypothetical protein